MRNAKQELLSFTKTDIRCANLVYEPDFESPDQTIILKEDYTPEELSEFVNKLDFEYDQGWGVQHLYGTVWFKDGTWLERREYDGSEWWEHKVIPEIPKNILSKMLS